MAVIYREAFPADAERLLAYAKTVGAESDNLTFGAAGLPLTIEQEAGILENFKNSPHSTMLLALDGDEIVGNACLQGSGNPRFRHRMELAISVRKSHWGQGIGSSLIGQLIAFAKENGAKVISLNVRSDNERAKSLYRKFGFVRFGAYEKYFKIGEEYFDADYMNLYL